MATFARHGTLLSMRGDAERGAEPDRPAAIRGSEKLSRNTSVTAGLWRGVAFVVMTYDGSMPVDERFLDWFRETTERAWSGDGPWSFENYVARGIAGPCW